MAVADLLMSQRRSGHTRCHKLLAQLPMSEQKTVGVDDRPTTPRARDDAQLR